MFGRKGPDIKVVNDVLLKVAAVDEIAKDKSRTSESVVNEDFSNNSFEFDDSLNEDFTHKHDEYLFYWRFYW